MVSTRGNGITAAHLDPRNLSLCGCRAIKGTRGCVVLVLLLQLPVFRNAFTHHSPLNGLFNRPLLDGIARPAIVAFVSAAAFSIATSQTACVLYILLCVYSVGVDTFSEVEYAAEVACRASGKALSGTCRTDLMDYGHGYLTFCKWRDLVAIALQLLALLLTAYVWVAVGCSGCGRPRRYTPRQLNTSRTIPSDRLSKVLAREAEQGLPWHHRHRQNDFHSVKPPRSSSAQSAMRAQQRDEEESV